MKPINLNSLAVFAVVARCGSLQEASGELNISRGAVSQRIKQLEIDLGVTLLERGAHGVKLTETGERCRDAVDRALATLETFLVELGEETDRVTLHLGPSTAAKWLMPRMNAFAQRFPEVALRTEVHEQVQSRSLGRNEISIWPGITADPNPDHHSRLLTVIRLAAVCGPDFQVPALTDGLEELLTLPLLQDAHRRWERIIEAKGLSMPQRLLNFDRSALALDAAIGGHGVAIAPTYMIERDVAAKRLAVVGMSLEPTRERLFVSWSRQQVRQKTLLRIVDWIVEEFGKEPLDGDKG